MLKLQIFIYIVTKYNLLLIYLIIVCYDEFYLSRYMFYYRVYLFLFIVKINLLKYVLRDMFVNVIIILVIYIIYIYLKIIKNIYYLKIERFSN